MRTKEAFVNDADIHTATAAGIFGVAKEDVNSEQRSQAKAINFGIIYGMGPQRLARETGVSTKEAKLLLKNTLSAILKLRAILMTPLPLLRIMNIRKR